MSGHSKWAQIKHKKALTDARKSKIFSKIAAMITIAAREGGGDTTANAKLRMSIEKAKEMNMPNENIERAIKRGIGELEGAKLEEIIYEALGPYNSAILIKVITDNKNRTAGELKKILAEFGGKLGERGATAWLFEEKGVVRLKKGVLQENQTLDIIELGAEDLKDEGEQTLIISGVNNLEKIKNYLRKNRIEIEGVEPEFIAKNYIKIEEKDKADFEKLFEALDEQNEVEEIYSNIKF